MKNPHTILKPGIWKLLAPCLVLLSMLVWLWVSNHGDGPVLRESATDGISPGQSMAQTSAPDGSSPQKGLRNTTGEPMPEDFDVQEVWENRRQLLAWAAHATGPEGIELGRRRAELMAEVIPRNPDLALEVMLPLPVYLALPPDVAALVEQPFAVAGSLDVVPDCERGGVTHFASWNGEMRIAHFAGDRGGWISSKNWVSLSGVELDGVAAIHGNAIWMMGEGEMNAARELFGIEDESRMENALVAGKARYLDEEARQRLAMLHTRSETLPGPDTGEVLALMKYPDAEETAALLLELHKVSESWTLSDKRVLFLNLKFADSPEPAESSAAIQAKLVECGVRTAEMSYGKMEFSAITVSQVLTLPENATSYDIPGGDGIDIQRIRNEGIALAAAEGLVSGSTHAEFSQDYDIVGVVIPFRPQAGWGGIASLAGSGHWINGARPFGVYIHEFGHNFGLHHASRWLESDPSQNPPTPPTASNLSTSSSVEPRHSEYGDSYDYMGSASIGHDFGVLGKSRLSWIDDDSLVEMTGDFPGDQVVRLQAFDEPTAHNGAYLGARVQLQESETFWVFYRGNHPDSRARAGASVVWQFSTTRGRLLDMSPESTATMDFVLKPGTTYTDPSGLVTITALDQGTSNGREWLDVRLVTGVVGNNNPVITEVVAQDQAAPMENLTFLASATDEDGDPLIYSWDFGDGRSIITSNSTITHRYLVGGDYEVRLGVLDGRGGYAEEWHHIVVHDPLLELAKVSIDSTLDLRCVAYVGGRFIACSSNQLWISFDGLEWEAMPSPSGSRGYHGIGSSEGRVLLLGESYVDGQWRGTIWRREDGLGWATELMPPGARAVNSHSEAGGVQVLGGLNGGIHTKLVGGEWQSIPLGESRHIYSVFHDGDRFWALGQSSLILVSSNGLDWSPPPAIPSGWTGSSFNTGLAIGGSVYQAGASGRLGVTWDGGESWVETHDGTVNLTSLTGIPERVICFERRFNADIPGHETTGLLATQDGGFWARTPLPAGIFLNQAAYGAGRAVIVGNQAAVHASGIIDVGNTAPVGNVFLPATVRAREDFSPSGGYSDADGDALRYFWDLGNGWLDFDANPVFNMLIGGPRTMRLAVVDERGGIRRQSFEVDVQDPFRSFVGVEGTDSESYTRTTIVGDQVFALSWGKLHSAPVGESLIALPSINPMYPYGLASDGVDLVLVGQTYDFPSQSWVGGISRGPVTGPVPLTKIDIGVDSRHFRAVADGGGSWVAVGDGGRIASSVSGGNWGERSSGVAGNLSDIAYGNGAFMAVGASGTVLVSGNGVNWSPVPGPTSSALSKVVFCGNGFLVCAGSGLYFTSDKGMNWNSHSLTNFQFRAAVWTGDAILVVGRFYDFDRARWVGHLLVSRDGVNWERIEDESILDVRDLAHRGAALVAVGDSGFLAFTDLTPAPIGISAPNVWVITADSSTEFRIGISSQPGQLFDVFRTVDLSDGFGDSPYDEAIPAASSGGTTIWIDPSPPPERGFYQIRRRQ